MSVNLELDEKINHHEYDTIQLRYSHSNVNDSQLVTITVAGSSITLSAHELEHIQTRMEKFQSAYDEMQLALK